MYKRGGEGRVRWGGCHERVCRVRCEVGVCRERACHV